MKDISKKLSKTDAGGESFVVKTIDKKMTREEFSTWLRKLNSRGKINEKY